MCVTKSAQGAGKLMFGVAVVLDGGSREVQKCQGVRDLGLAARNCGQSAEVTKFQSAIIAGISQRRIKLLSVLRSAHKWF